MEHPRYIWSGGMPGQGGIGGPGVIEFTPGVSTKYKHPRSAEERKKSYDGITTIYLHYYRHSQPDLAYFELEGGCAYFRDPEQFTPQNLCHALLKQVVHLRGVGPALARFHDLADKETK